MQNNPIQTTCGAKTRKGHPCKTRPVISRKRCRMHGGTNNGAPKGSQNDLKHGYYTKENIAKRSELQKIIREFKALSGELNDQY
jgi:hypothetical protein